MRFYRDQITGFDGSWNSGIACLHLLLRGPIPCENPTTVRLLDQLYGQVIQPGHVVDVQRIAGQEIVFSYEYGVMLGALIPLHQWVGPQIEFGEGVDIDETEGSC